MVEKLKHIHWDDYFIFGYMDGKLLTDLICNLVSDSSDERKAAQNIIRRNLGDYTRPFYLSLASALIEVLSSNTYPDPEFLLSVLFYMACVAHEDFYTCAAYKNVFQYSYCKLCSGIYETILAAYPLYHQYLDYPLSQVRSLAVKLMMLKLPNHRLNRILLKRRLRRETSAATTAVLLQELGKGIENFMDMSTRESRLYNGYKATLQNYLSPEYERLLRYAAAVALTQIGVWRIDALDVDLCLDIFFDALKYPIKVSNDLDFELTDGLIGSKVGSLSPAAT